MTTMRTLKLLGRLDPAAPRAFAAQLLLAFLLVAVLTVPLIVYPQKIAALVSDDAEVAGWLEAIVGILVPHMLTRIVNLVCAQILIPMGSGEPI